MKVINKVILVLLMGAIFILLLTTHVDAASASISSVNSVEVNKPITISVTGSGVQWNLKLKVDGVVIAESSELENYTSNKNISFSGTYTPTTTGTKTITLEGSVTEFNDGSTIVKFNSKTITINPQSSPETPVDKNPEDTTTKSSNANLSALSVSPSGSGLSPKFNSSTTSYTMSVENSVTKVTISATKAHSGATVTGTGTRTLDEGTNAINIKVTAEDGTTKTYKISINRKASEVETVPNVVEETLKEQLPEKLALSAIMVSDDLVLSPAFNQEIYEYTLQLVKDLDKIELNAIPNIDGALIEVLGNKDLIEGENVITILVRMDGYETVTYQIIVNKVLTKETEGTIEDVLEDNENYLALRKWVIITLASVICVAGIIFAIIEYKYSNKKKQFDIVDFTPLGSKKKDEIEEVDHDKEERLEKNKNEEFKKEAEIQKQIELEEKNEEKKKKGKHF